MIRKKTIRKFLFRWLVVTVVFLLVKVTMEHQDDAMHSFLSAPVIYYYFTAFFLFMVTWEYNDWLIIKQLKNGGLDLKNSLQILFKTMAFLIPLSVLVYYLALYPFKDLVGHPTDEPFVCLVRDVLRAILLGLAVILFNLLYFSMKQRDQMAKQMEDLKKEMLVSKYSSLKNQISPHFLFNSLNTLTSLMYENRDLASDFLSRLASSYRYILDNTEEDLVSLKKELHFLDSYIFMMNVRHEGALLIKTEIKVDTEAFLVPTLSLQMLVENALKHNYFSKEKPLEIHIFSVGKIGLVVENTLRKRMKTEESTELGLKNIKKRYSFYTNQEVAIEIEEEHFKVTMPLLHRNIQKTQILSVS
ncbi:MAG: sensor histidine kinase [Maribacter sp.]